MAMLWLIGMMGSGKTEVGREAAALAGVEFTDVDDRVAAAAGQGIADIFTGLGEAAFRELEAVAIAALGAAGGDRVVATGGGAVLRPDNVAVMRAAGIVVWLDAPVAGLAARIGDGAGRPLLAGTGVVEALARIAAERREHYRAAAHHRIDTSGLGVAAAAGEVVRVWRGAS